METRLYERLDRLVLNDWDDRDYHMETIYKEKPEVPVEKSNGSCHSIWNVL